MARIIDISGGIDRLGASAWQLASTAADAVADPSGLAETFDWISAAVPGTVAAAKLAAGRWARGTPSSFGDQDHWYRTTFAGEGAATLSFEGLATLAVVWFNGREILSSRTMFRRYDVDVVLQGQNELVICFRSLSSALSGPMAQGRWRPRMITPSNLRHVRTTALGHMPGWCPSVEVVGPWRAISCVMAADRVDVDVAATLDGREGVLSVSVGSLTAMPVSVVCGGQRVALAPSDDGRLSGTVRIPDVALWWPHTHGTLHLYDVTLAVGDREAALGRVGFRSIEVDRGADGQGFGLVVNGVPVFCRGALWASADLVSMPTTREAFAPWLGLVKDAGMTMIRVPGTTVYEAQAFYDLADEMGILVWQDFMFANFDYPAGDASFADDVRAEAASFLTRQALSPSLAVLSGGSEVYQQAAMLGLPARKYLNPIFEEILPGAVKSLRPDVPYVVGSPSGGALPFVVDQGIGHYYGVGGYKRALSDARHAGVRFAAECLAFANVPSEASRGVGEDALVDIRDGRWKARIPRDAGSSWDFEDIRDHYVRDVFQVEPQRLRYEDPERYLELGRAAQAVVMEHVFAEWMRPQSSARGGLVLMLQDFEAAAAWGLIGADGAPKSSYFALKRRFSPLRIAITDEGVNGLALHVANERAEARDVVVRLQALRDGRTQVLAAKRAMTLAPRSAQSLSAFELLGSFFDLSYAYRFNGPQHDAVIAQLVCAATGDVLSDDVYFPLGHGGQVPEGQVSASVERDGEGYVLKLRADRLARFVHIVDAQYLPSDDWFHVPPKSERVVRLSPRPGTTLPPKGIIKSLNCPSTLAYEAQA